MRKHLIPGGLADFSVALSDCFSLVNFTWIRSPEMLSKRYYHASAVLENDTVLVSGGVDRDRNGVVVHWNTTERFDGEKWTQGPDLPLPLSLHCMLVLENGDIFVAGGITNISTDSVTYHDETFVYSISEEKWSRKADMITPKGSFPCALHQGEVWASDEFSGNVEIFDPQANEWKSGPNLISYPTESGWVRATYGKFVSSNNDLIFVAQLVRLYLEISLLCVSSSTI